MRRDPLVRKDGKCAKCRKKRALAVKSPYGGDQAINDPFCSTVCCREWHDCALVVPHAKKLGRPRESATAT